MSTERQGLAELYDDKPLETPEPQAQQGADSGPAVGTGEAPAPAAAAASDPVQGAPPAPKVDTPAGYAPIAALEDERRKRQRLEREYQELNRRLMAPQPEPAPVATQAKPPQLPDPITAPDEFVAAVMERAIKEAEAKAEAKFRERDERDYTHRADESEAQFADKHGDDYHAKKAAFVEELEARAAAGDDSLLRGLQQARNPAAYAYEHGSKILFYREVGQDPTAYEKRVIERYLASQNGGQQPPAPARGQAPANTPQRSTPAVPQSLAGMTSTGPRTAGARPIARRSLNELYD
jgi:hypothetical protein